MSDAKPKYANFPDGEPKVVIGANINATTIKTLTRLTIGTYEMSFTQQEKGKATRDALKSAANALAKSGNMTVTQESSRDFVGICTIANADIEYKVWITTPFELTQAGHVIWVRYRELTGERKVGVVFKLATGYSVDDISTILKNASKNAVALADGEPFTLKGNPPPRFQKKAAVAAEPGAEAAQPADATQSA